MLGSTRQGLPYPLLEESERFKHRGIFEIREMQKGYKQLRKDPLRVGDLILVHQPKAAYSRSRTHELGNYRILEIPDNATGIAGWYALTTLDIGSNDSFLAVNSITVVQHETIRVRDALHIQVSSRFR
jgi:hypothetical protein